MIKWKEIMFYLTFCLERKQHLPHISVCIEAIQCVDDIRGEVGLYSCEHGV